MDIDDAPVWSSDRFREIDESRRTLLLQLVRAVFAMAVAFVVSRWLTGAVGTGGDQVWAQGLVFVVVGCVSIYLVSARPIRRAIIEQRRAIEEHEDAIREEAERHEFASHLHDALEMADVEDEALDVVGRALGLVSEHGAELLLADHSRSHLRRAVTVADRDEPGCGVASPWACPAVRRGQTLEFASSDALAACPRLRDRARGACSAVCVPVTVLGTPMGVIHSTGADGLTRERNEVLALEVIATQSGSRVGVLRAMQRSERQAATDPLTGQVNRRILDEAVRELREDGRQYALAMADLDHFKLLNDTFGHDTGDRALRLFARTLRDSVRDDDVVCRYGGEEFVLLFPGCTVVEAAIVVHRAREQLNRRLLTGDVPAFTASFGMADSTFADDFEDVLRLADTAMFRAKQLGRDRLVIADEEAMVGGAE